MRPRLGSAISDSAAHATADPSRWTHGVGVARPASDHITPTSLPSAILALQPKSYWALLAET